MWNAWREDVELALWIKRTTLKIVYRCARGLPYGPATPDVPIIYTNEILRRLCGSYSHPRFLGLWSGHQRMLLDATLEHLVSVGRLRMFGVKYLECYAVASVLDQLAGI